MDLSRLDVVSAAEEGAWMEVIEPVTGESLDIRIHFVGADSQRYKNADKRVFNDQMRDRAALSGASATAEKREKAREGMVQLMARCALGWESIERDEHGNEIGTRQTITAGGQELEFSVENLEALLRKYPPLYEQSERFIHRRAHFLSSSPTR